MDTYEKKLKEALNDNTTDYEVVRWIEQKFPELRESEDEIVIAALKSGINGLLKKEYHLKGIGGISFDRIIAWLEKQGDNRLMKALQEANKKIGELVEENYYLKEQGEQNLAFIEKGKWYVCIRTSYKPNGKDFIEGKTYYAKEDYKIIGECGEVDIATDNPEEFFRPATDEEIPHEQKPAWSKDDEKVIEALISLCDEVQDNIPQLSALKDWLKSLKDRVLPQPKQEWSDEDKTALGDALWCCKQAASIAKDENDMGNVWYAERWLKSLRPQNRWKPSVFHLECISDAIAIYEKHGINAIGLKEILEELKKLKN